jgi:hypothetical protein
MYKHQEYILRSTIHEHLLGARGYSHGPTLNEALISEGLSQGMVKDAVQFIVGAGAEYGLGAVTLPAAGAGLAVGPTVETIVDAAFAAEAVSSTISAVATVGDKLAEYGELWEEARSAYGGDLAAYYQTLVKIVRQALADLGEKAGATVGDLAEKLKGAIEKLIGRLVGSLKAGIKLVIPDATIGLAAAVVFEEGLSKLAENAFDLLTSAVNKVQMLKDFVADPSIAVDFFEDIFEQVVELMTSLSQKVQDTSWVTAMLAGGPVGGAALKKLGPAGLEKAASLIKGQIPTIIKTIDSVLTVLVPTAITAVGLFQILITGDWEGDEDTAETQPDDSSENKEKEQLAASYIPAGDKMRITKRQLRRIIRESYYDEAGNYVTTSGRVIPANTPNADLEPERFRSKDEAEDAAVAMVFGDEPSQRLGNGLPYEVRIVSIEGEYALYAMEAYADRYKGEGRVIAAVPRGGSVRYGRKIG